MTSSVESINTYAGWRDAKLSDPGVDGEGYEQILT